MTSIFDQYEQDCSKSDSSYNILKPSKFTATVQDLVCLNNAEHFCFKCCIVFFKCNRFCNLNIIYE